MGLLVAGKWTDRWYDTDSNQGEFKRSESQFRHWISADGSAGPSGKGGFKAEPGRYHLYVSLACPWAHRTLIFRALKGLQEMISVSIVDPLMADLGWTFGKAPQGNAEPLSGAHYLHQIYTTQQADYSGRVTVPVLWDKHQGCIVNNESAEIIRMLNSAFDHLGATEGDYYPSTLRAEIETINQQVYERINNGVYKVGFSTEQAVYNREVEALFEALEYLELKLQNNRYLLGDQITEADWRLFTTLVRFDPVYHGHFKCNLKQLQDYPNLWAYTRELYQWPGIAETVNMEHIKEHYYRSHTMINPTGIVPLGPQLDLNLAHHREGL